MNEQTKELAMKYANKMGNSVLHNAEHLEKFAELIVFECAEQSMSIGRYNTPSGVTPDLSIAIAVGLKKHFGVEE